MLDTIEKPGAERPSLLEGLLTREQLTAETGWKERTILRREAEGLPVIVIGADRFYPADKVRNWILSRMREHSAPRRGRPRKLNAA